MERPEQSTAYNKYATPPTPNPLFQGFSCSQNVNHTFSERTISKRFTNLSGFWSWEVFVCILNKDNGIIYIGLACYLLLQQIFLGAGKSLNEQYEFVSALLTQISWTNHL